MKDCHLRYGHIGPKKCSDILKESCKFNNMERTVRKMLKMCEICQKAKVNNRKQEGLITTCNTRQSFSNSCRRFIWSTTQESRRSDLFTCRIRRFY